MYKRQGKDPQQAFDAFNGAQDHVLAAARTHVERMVLEAFAAMVDRCEDEEVRVVLDRLCDLYALTLIEADAAWFLQHHRITATRAKLVHKSINELCAQLRPDALALVEGLGVPATWLHSSMLEDDEASMAAWTPGASR